MAGWSGLTTRHLQPEVMDRPDLDEGLHVEALDSLARLNFWSRSPGILWPSVRRLAQQLGTKSLTVLDVASGAGDVPIGLWSKARRAGIDLKIVGCDISPCAVKTAAARAAKASANVRFQTLDVLANPPAEQYDVVTCSLFLHHLEEGQGVAVLKAMSAAARHLLLINDLERSTLGYLLAKFATRLLSRSEVVWIDGPRSVEGAFTAAEALKLAESAGLPEARVERRWPCRFLLSWNRSKEIGLTKNG